MRPITPLALFAGLALTACSAPNPYSAGNKLLADESARIESGDYAAAARKLELRVVQTEGEDDDAGLKLQRLYATYLLARAHALASLGKPFLSEPVVDTGLGSSTSKSVGVGHVVAASMYAALGRELSGQVEKAPRENKGVKALPAEFDGFEPKDVRAHLAVCNLVGLARLGFDDRVREIVGGATEMHTFDTCKALLERLRIARGLRPWVYSANFDYLKRSNGTEPEAYKFAVQSVVTSADSGGAFDAQRREELSRWITSGSNYEYRCPEHRVLVQPELGRCQEIGCQRALHEFTPQLKQR